MKSTPNSWICMQTRVTLVTSVTVEPDKVRRTEAGALVTGT